MKVCSCSVVLFSLYLLNKAQYSVTIFKPAGWKLNLDILNEKTSNTLPVEQVKKEKMFSIWSILQQPRHERARMRMHGIIRLGK